MGRAGIRRKSRKRAVKQSHGDGWDLKYSPYSPAGEVEGAGRFARGLSYLSPGRRFAARVVVVVVVVAPLTALVVTLVVHLVSR